VAKAEAAQRRAALAFGLLSHLPDMIIYRLLSKFLAAARSKHSNRAALSGIRVHCSKTGGAAAASGTGAALKAAAPPVDDLSFSIATPRAVASGALAALAARSCRFKSATSD
jgi:hypothetical protein